MLLPPVETRTHSMFAAVRFYVRIPGTPDAVQYSKSCVFKRSDSLVVTR